MLRKYKITLLVLLASSLVLIASWLTLPAVQGAPQETPGPRFTEWSTPVPLIELNTPDQGEFAGSISWDGLSLYISRINAVTGEDIYVCHRPDANTIWGPPIRLPDGINTSYTDRYPVISPDGHWLYFTTNRPGGKGVTDIHVSYRADVSNDFAWEMPVILEAFNTAFNDGVTNYFVDPETGIPQLYFHRSYSATVYLIDIYASALGPNGWATPTPVNELNAPAGYGSQSATLRHDGLEVYLTSNRPGTLGRVDTWVATRASTKDPWSTPQNVTVLNTPDIDQGPVLSRDAQTIFFTRGSGVAADIYVSHRELIKTCAGASACFRSTQYYLNNLSYLENSLGNAAVLIGGVNYNHPIRVGNHLGLIRTVLQGNHVPGLPPATPTARLNREFLAAQLSLALAGNPNGALKGELQCYDSLGFMPAVRLSNGVRLTSFSTLGELLEQARLALCENRTADMDALADVLDLLNGNDPSGGCHQ